MKQEIALSDIRTDGGTQQRARFDDDVASAYVEKLAAKVDFPPIVVFDDGESKWLADGFYRYRAHETAGKKKILADVRKGTQRDAILFSVGANSEHGARRTNADKEKAVRTLLEDKEWSTFSDRKLAELASVTHPFVAAIRSQVVTVTTCEEPSKRTGKDGKQQSATKTKPRKHEAPEDEAERHPGEDEPEAWHQPGAAPLVDDNAEPVYEQAMPDFADKPEILRVGRMFDSLMADVEKLGKLGGARWIHTQGILSSLRSSKDAINQGKPGYNCPYCKGSGKNDCPCKGHGWVTKVTWKQAPK